ncbi:MAG TPA: gliding motility-associated C-terminal domain-containing protein [Bacteroidia bacterium]|jgi:gliding motility-associated-like protein|nr:gliding motility-associated C-terminal domain-containing protein [Bacteroidia bacterium]
MKKGYFFAFFCLFTFLLSGKNVISVNPAKGQPKVNAAPTLTVTITPPVGTTTFCTGNPYQFTGNANPGPILFWQWSCLSSVGVNIINPNQNGTNIIFNNPGSYTLTLIASNTSGVKDSVKYSLTVVSTPTVIASPTSGAVICLGGTGTNLYASGATTYTWSGTGITTTYANGDSTNVNPSTAGIFTYTVVGSKGGCVSAPTTITATVSPAPTVTVTYSPKDTICSTSTTSITVNGLPSTATYTWAAAPTAGLGTNSGGGAPVTPVYYGVVDTIYHYTINYAVPGCPAYPTYTASVYVIPTPTVFAVSDTVDNCNKMGDSLRVTSLPPKSSGTTYSWTPNSHLSSTTGNPVYANPTNPTMYYITPTYKGCKGLKDSIKVLIGDTTLATIDAQYLIICAGQKDTLVGLPALNQLNGTYQYYWAPTTGPSTVTPINPKKDTVIIKPIATTIYTLTVKGTCVKRKQTELTVYVNNCSPLVNSDFTMTKDTICVNHCIYFTDLTHNFNVLPLFYQWIFVGGNAYGSTGGYSVHLPDTAYYAATDSTPIPGIKVCYHVNSSLNTNGVFPVTMAVSHGPGTGPPVIVTHFVKVDAGPLANAGPNVTINLGDSTQLNGTNSSGNFAITTYSWTPPDSLGCPSPYPVSGCPKPWANPSQTTAYYLTVTDVNGCKSTDSMVVYVDLKCYDPFIPTAFSPNADGKNDVLYVRSNCLENFTFKVFDRWGEKVFESSTLNFGWDGTFRNTPVNAGVFVWILEGFLSNGKEVKKHGSTTVIR